MQSYPHHYVVAAVGTPSNVVALNSDGLPTIDSAPPREFDGPGDRWSPEQLLCAAVADCFILTFRAIARASKFEWSNLECSVEGTLERASGGAKFTRFKTHATLHVAAGTDVAQAKQLLEKAEHNCLVSNSLSGERLLSVEVIER